MSVVRPDSLPGWRLVRFGGTGYRAVGWQLRPGRKAAVALAFGFILVKLVHAGLKLYLGAAEGG